jgi:hypothetical protein
LRAVRQDVDDDRAGERVVLDLVGNYRGLLPTYGMLPYVFSLKSDREGSA